MVEAYNGEAAVVATDVSRSALEASERRYRRLFESAKDGILILDAETGTIVDVNPFLIELIGYSRDELLDRSLWEIGQFKDVAASKESFAKLQTNEYVRYEHLPLETRDGRKIAVEFVSNVYTVDGVRVIQCNVRDITLRRRAEDALRMRDRAIQAVEQGIVIAEAGGDQKIIYVSPGFTRLAGYAEAETLGRNCRFLQGPETDPQAKAQLHQAVEERRACSVELLNYRRDGSTFWNHVALSPVTDDAGFVTHLVGVQTDVTERRTLETQFLRSQRMEAVGQLAGGIAHDFNNVLSVILSYAEMGRDELRTEDPVRSDLEEIRKAALRASDLTHQLLALSRQQVMVPEVLNLDHRIAAVAKLLNQLLGADIALTLLPTNDLWTIKADPGQLEQILMNLAINARDAMPGGGELTIETENVVLDHEYAQIHHEVTPGSYVMLSVTDTGIGMDKATQDRIFEPFFTTKESGKGTGLGLASVFGIVKQSGGHIWVYSEPGRGTTFKLYFPRVSGVAEARPEEPTTTFARATETILLVEDDDQVRTTAETILRRSGYVVLVAPNAGEALLICEKHGANIDLLLTDAILPRMSGRQLADRLAVLRPRMKVLFMSGYADDAIRQHGILDSNVAYLQKPFTPASLTRKVRGVLHLGDETG